MEESRTIVMKDRRITTRLLVERLGVGTKAGRQILERDLQKKFVQSLCCCPSRLNKHSIVLNVVAVSLGLLSKIVTCGVEWHGTNLPIRRKPGCKNRLSRQCWSSADAAGIVYREFVPECTTLNIHCYLGMMERLGVRMRHGRNG